MVHSTPSEWYFPPGLPAKHVRKAPLERLCAEAAMHRLFLQSEPRFRATGFQRRRHARRDRLPTHFEFGAVSAKGSVLARVGGQFVERHAECLRNLGR